MRRYDAFPYSSLCKDILTMDGSMSFRCVALLLAFLPSPLFRVNVFAFPFDEV